MALVRRNLTTGASRKKVFNVVAYTFDGFEQLDLFGPLEMFSCLRYALQNEHGVKIQTIGLGDTVRSSGGPRVVNDLIYKKDELPEEIDVFVVPGGKGTRELIKIPEVVDMVRDISMRSTTRTVMSVCTGSALLAKAGLLDNVRATSNKLSFDWVKTQGPNVRWVDRARYVFDGKFATSSGVSAGTDLSVALIEKEFGSDIAKRVALYAEYVPNLDPSNDPFAKL